MKVKGASYLLFGFLIMFAGALTSVGENGKGPAVTKKQSSRIKQVRDPAEGQPQSATFRLGRDARISATIENEFLTELLNIMVEKRLLELRGSVPQGDPLTIAFSNLTLQEALEKMMKGYNYVFVERGIPEIPLLVIVGKAERGRSTDRNPVVVASVPKTDGTVESKGYYVPPEVTEWSSSSPALPMVIEKPLIGESSGTQPGSPEQVALTPAADGGGGRAVQKGETNAQEGGPQHGGIPLLPGPDPNYRPGGPGYIPAPILPN